MKAIACISLVVLALINATSASAQLGSQESVFCTKEIKSSELSCSEVHPRFSAQLHIVDDGFTYQSRDSYKRYPTARGKVEKYGRCWRFVPARYGTPGCGVFDDKNGTLTFTSESSDCEITIVWRLCSPGSDDEWQGPHFAP
jgi:hypothetical protein